jgi:hypothetical protein
MIKPLKSIMIKPQETKMIRPLRTLSAFQYIRYMTIKHLWFGDDCLQ